MKLIYSILCASFMMLLFGCKKDYDKSVFDQLPQERSQQTLTDYKNMLTSAPYGWVAYVYTGSGSLAFTYYFKFDSTNRVVTNCDLATSTITTPVESSYRLQSLQMTTLIFDTYSYLHLLADPNPNALGGTSGQGFYSDYEFYFLNVSKNKDTITMEGAQKGMPLTLVKVTDDNKADVADGFNLNGGVKMAEIRDRIQGYINSSMFFNMRMGDGKQMSLSYAGASLMYFRYQNDTTGKLINQATMFSYTAKGIHFRDTIWYKSVPFTDLVWNQGTNNGLYIDGIFNTSQVANTPDFPLSSLFGNGFTGMYQPAGYPDPGINAVSTSYKDLIKSLNDSLNARGYTFREMDYLFSPYKSEMSIYVSVSKAGANYYAIYTYSFALAADGKTYTFTFEKQDVGGDNLRTAMTPLLNYFETGSKQMKLDYFQSASYGMMGQFKSVDDPNFYFSVILF